ncbi:hypothetical protein [Flavobacterium frigoris]|uniref:Uncharacterized protein n=1 Tax=Flavobacterium frigoris TaxID=229204 RepID=A0A1H9RPT9_FLAFI|nr:hypothetical protein [Flavobacterium frigoris]SER74706.1 hypothetical protein SAMN05444355_1239 [Flavobacterium frigoris]
MKNLFVLIAVFTIFTIGHSQSKSTSSRFSKFISQINGDLNKDNIKDVVKVYKDPRKGDFKTSVFFGTPDGNYKLIIENSTLLSNSEGRMEVENFPSIEIKKGILDLTYELMRGQHNYKFRYQNGNFEMIGFKRSSSDGHAYFETEEANLSTRTKITTVERYDVENEKPEITKEKMAIAKLPIFQTFNPETSKY